MNSFGAPHASKPHPQVALDGPNATAAPSTFTSSPAADARHETSSTDAVITVNGLAKTFDVGFLGAVRGLGRWASRLQIKGIARRVEAVRGISLQVNRGEIYGFLGPNGAGKTTTIKMLMGLIHPTAGTGTLLGHPLGDRNARHALGFLPEHPYFYEYLRPLEFLDFYGRLFGIPHRERKRRAEILLDRVGLTYAANRPIRKFSKGMVQRVGVAQALINDPDLVVLDEPMSGLDPIGRKDVRDLIFDLKSHGKTVFFSSHILQDVEMLCDRVAILVNGRVHDEGLLRDMLRSPSDEIDIVAAGIDEIVSQELGARAASTERIGDTVQFRVGSNADVNAFVGQILASGGQLVRVVPHRRSLEEILVASAIEGGS